MSLYQIPEVPAFTVGVVFGIVFSNLLWLFAWLVLR
jgi:hypothetical protein